MSTELFQTNNFDKYDQIYLGYVDAGTAPQVTLQPSSGQNGPLTVVAQRVRFELLSNSSSSSGLNGLFEFNPNLQVIDSSSFADSTIDQAGLSLNNDATIGALAVVGDAVYVGGSFKSTDASNILKISGQDTASVSGGGLNSEVMAIYQNGTQLYVGGNFTSTSDNKATGLNGVALYDASANTWTALGAGVNGVVTHIVPFTLNFTANKPESVLAVTGFFSQVNGFDSNATFAADGLAIWIPGRKNWLANTDLSSISLAGQLNVGIDVPGYSPVFAGSVSSQALSSSGVVGLTGSTDLSLQHQPVKFQQSSSPSLKKRALGGQNFTGVITGLIYTENNLNITVLAGHFAATGSAGANISNLLFMNGTTSVTGIEDFPEDSTITTLGTQGTTLFAGGSISGTVGTDKVNGIFAYNLATATVLSTQPDGLAGTSVSVNAIAPQPSSSDVYVGGQFQSAGSLTCPGLCVYNTERNQWNQPGTGIAGTVNAMTWVSKNNLVLAGNLTIGQNATTMATYDPEKSQFQSFNGADAIPGPVTALCAANKQGTQFWVAGQANNGSAFLERYDGSEWQSAGSTLGAGSTILGIQVFTLQDNHDDTDLLEQDQALLVLGSLVLPDFGNASSALFNGTTFTPFILSTTSSNSGGTLVAAFVENPQNFFQGGKKHLAVGFVVLIALAIALGLIFCITVGGFLAERHRRRREGYVPAPTSMPPSDTGNMSRIPPNELFGTIGQSNTKNHL